MFTISISTDNAAFDPDPKLEVVRILRGIIERLEIGDERAYIRDANGNTIGSWSLK